MSSENNPEVNSADGGDFLATLRRLMSGGSIAEKTARSLRESLTLFAELTLRRGANAARFDVDILPRLEDRGFPTVVPLTMMVIGGDAKKSVTTASTFREKLDQLFPEIDIIRYAIERGDDDAFTPYLYDENGKLQRDDETPQEEVSNRAVTTPPLGDTPPQDPQAAAEQCNCIGCRSVRTIDLALEALETAVPDSDKTSEAVTALQALKLDILEKKNRDSGNPLSELLQSLRSAGIQA